MRLLTFASCVVLCLLRCASLAFEVTDHPNVQSHLRSVASLLRRRSSTLRPQTSSLSCQTSSIRNQSSSIRHPPSGIRNPTSGVLHQESFIRRPPSGILHQASGVRNPPSGVRNPPSGVRIRHQASASGVRIRYQASGSGIRRLSVLGCCIHFFFYFRFYIWRIFSPANRSLRFRPIKLKLPLVGVAISSHRHCLARHAVWLRSSTPPHDLCWSLRLGEEVCCYQ
ncbi:uncharacterized protein LOC108705929 isoform X1 [Xenopus laevis]|uniref:Uncharacterized protein LOC108705929 isoform X1 n=1 Tax=Xenopus laevis TaxID=8355 RepID=A0A8J1MXS7_XENLA|nr:uncharacterized protein LOC108705929 isoform X1 [Xenopus laevis]XP_041446600.1 uncharacterized protein LOC108705929 isoform X1 [Xenopus laevis]